MYSASATFNTKIKQSARGLHWSGTITAVGGSTYTFGDSDIISGSITRSISSQTLNIGTAYASTLSIELVLAGVSRYELYNGTISVSCELDGATDVIPMGIYNISEASQTADHITLKAYDNMVKFDDVAFSFSANTSIQLAYNWISAACSACGVTLGMTSAQIKVMPNGRRKTGFTDVVADVKTWRDVLCYISAYLGSYAYIGRDGKLYLGTYGSVSVDTIPASFRFSSDLSDFRTTYDGLYSVYKDEGLQEYVSNTNTGGLVLDLGTNPFLQFSNSSNRHNALQEIIDLWDGVYYVPFAADLPIVPIYDVGDVLTFTDNQAGAYDIGAITEITYTIGGTMSVKCSGDNPRLADAQDRFTKTLEGIASEYDNTRNIGGKEFWILSMTNDTSSMTVGSTETQIAEIEWTQKTTVQDIEMIVTVDAVLSATAEVQIRMTVDDDVNFEMTTDVVKSLVGERVFVRTNPQKVTGTGTHTAKVYMTVTDSPLLWSDIQ